MLDKDRKKKTPAAEEPQVENFLPERYTLAGVTDERLSWISKTTWDAREHFGIKGVGVDCIQLGKWLNENPAYRISIKTVPLHAGIDAQTIYIGSLDKYLIGMNQNKLRYPFRSTSDFRANFTIAHELGHILLGHAAIADVDKGSQVRDEEDTEADEFAGQFLMPENLLLRCSFRWPSKVAEQFKVSHTALWQRLNNLKRLDLLSDEEKENRYIRCCDVCGNTGINFGFDMYCSICGKEVNKDTWGVLPQRYSGPESEKKIVMICPRCGANLYHVKSKDCSSCRLPRRNSCENHCSAEIRTSDRHCWQCGKQTLYLKDGLLTHWWHAMITGEMVEKPRVKKRMIISDSDINF